MIAKKTCAGIFSFLPLGLIIQQKIEDLVRKHQNKIGMEVYVSSINSAKFFYESGRSDAFMKELVTFVDNKGRKMSICPTAEEIFMFSYMYNNISYTKFPVYLYQISRKFRDEIRPRNYILRCCEFVMKDGYGFSINEDQNNELYQKVRKSYIEIFNSMKINFDIVPADPKEMLGLSSEEFIYPTNEIVECKYELNKQSKTGIEIAHIFNLGTIYSCKMDIKYLSKQNKKSDIFMSSYGIGIYRSIFIVCYNLFNNKEISECLIIYKIIFVPRKYNDNIYNIYSRSFSHNSIVYDIYNEKYEERIKNSMLMFCKYIVYELEYKFYIYNILNKEDKVFEDKISLENYLLLL